MIYNKYQVSRNLSWQVIINERINELPINVVKLCRSMGIAVKLYNPKDNNSGMTVTVNGAPVILVAANEPRERQRFTIAHELGHILLGHVGKYKLVNREPSESDNPIEQEANVFASRLLAPACVLWGCNAKTAEDIMKLCDISRTAAEFRQQRMDKLLARNKFLLHPLERQVYSQFTNYISKNKL